MPKVLPFQKTTVYKEALNAIREMTEFFPRNGNPAFRDKIESEALNLTTTLAKALNEYEPATRKTALNKSVLSTETLISILDTAKNMRVAEDSQISTIATRLYDLRTKITGFNDKRKKILILYSQIGQGHISAAKALHEGITHLYGLDVEVEAVDFMEFMSSVLTKVTQRTYDGSTKFLPVLCKLFFEGTDSKWPIKLLNKANYPFAITKLKKFFDEKKPDIIVSTFPLWDYMTAEIWKKNRKNAKFISIVTDSITIHNGWVVADTDYHIVANEDTALVLKGLGVKDEKIKILGFPVRLDFTGEFDRRGFLEELGLNPDLFTILFLPAAQNPRRNIKIMKELVQNHADKNVIVITGRDPKIKPKIEKLGQSPNLKVIGWTDEMPKFIRAADVVVTKAGGATVMECIAAKKPLVITFIIPGQEQGNAELIKRYGLGIIAPSADMSISESIKYIKDNHETFAKQLEKASNPQAALKIAEFVHEQISD